MKSSMHEEKWFLVFKHGNFKNPPKSFGVTKKDRCLIFHIHDLNLFKSWSNLGFDQDSNGPKNLEKNQKRMKNQST